MRKILYISLSCISCSYIQGNTAGPDYTGQTLHRYLWANYQAYKNNIPHAKKWYQELQISGHEHKTYEGYIAFLYQTHRYMDIVHLAQKISISTIKNPETRLLYVLTLQKVGRQQDALVELMKLNQEFKHNFEITYKTVEAFIERKELHNALNVIETFLASAPKRSNHFILYFLKAQLCAQLGKLSEAQEYITLCLEKQPAFNKGWLLFAFIKEQCGKIESAIKGYTTYLELSSEHSNDIRKHLVELTAFQQEKIRQKQRTLTIANTCAIFVQKKQYKELLTLIQQQPLHDQTSIQYRLFTIQALIGLNKHQEAIDTVVSWALEKKDTPQWLAVLHLLLHTTIDSTHIRHAFETLHKHFPHDNSIVLYLADLYTRSAQHYNDAIALYRKALTMNNKASLTGKIYYQLAYLHYHKKDYATMLTMLNCSITQDYTYAPAHNLLAYYYATTEKDFTKATHHITCALKQSPTNPHFLDTQATIAYKQKNYEHACATWQKIATHIPPDAVAHAHYEKAQKRLTLNAQNIRSPALEKIATSKEHQE